MMPYTLRLMFMIFAMAATGYGAVVDIIVLQTTDIHATIGPPEENVDGDWRRLATALQRERATTGADHLLLLDTGDTVQGSLTGVVSQGEASLCVLDALKYDAWGLGNHELDFGVDRLRQLTQQVKTPIITGNLQLRGEAPFAAYRIFERGEAKIAVIGMTTPSLPHWLSGPRYEGYTVEPALEVLQRVIPDVMRQRPDAIILAMHQGFLLKDDREMNEVKAIAYRFPQIDLILGGHTNRRFAGTRVASSWYVQPGEHAVEYARIRLTIDTVDHTVKRLESTLVPVPPETSLQEDAAAAVADWVAKTEAFSKRPITVIPTTLSAKGKPGIDNAISELLCRSLAWKGGAQLALHGILSEESWPAGETLDEGRLFRTIPYENYLCVARLTLDELRIIIQEQLDNRNSYTYNGIWGIEVKVDNWQVKSLRLPGREVGPDERLSIALTSYNVAGGGNRYTKLRTILRQPESQLVYHDINSRDILREYVKSDADWAQLPRRWLR